MVISIEGNIGSGKSTIIKYLQDRCQNKRIIFLQEPVDEWETIKDKEGNTILSLFYKNNKQHSFSFQMMAYISRLHLLREAIKTNPNSIIITERSLYTDKYVFAKMLYDNKNMSEIEYTIYNKWFHEFMKDIPIAGIIYIKTDPVKCKERIALRNRPGETIALSYLIGCHCYHENWLSSVDVPVSTIDGNINLDVHKINEFMKKIEKHIHDFAEQNQVHPPI